MMKGEYWKNYSKNTKNTVKIIMVINMVVKECQHLLRLLLGWLGCVCVLAACVVGPIRKIGESVKEEKDHRKNPFYEKKDHQESLFKV